MASMALILSVLFALTGIPLSLAQCPSNATNINYYGGNCYDQVFTTPQMTWQEARDYCESAPNGALFGFTSSSERSDVRSWLYSYRYSYIWTGAYTDDFTVVNPNITTTTDASTTTSSTLSNCTSNCTTTTAATTPFWWWQTTTMSTTTRAAASNGFLLDRYVTWNWAARSNGTESSISRYSSYWDTGFPEAATGACVAWRYGMLRAIPCSTKLNFICEYTCGGTINSAERTTISSPRYPGFYGNNARCEWDVDVVRGRAVLELTAFSTESCCDHLYVYESRSSSNYLYKFSGSTVPDRLISPSNTLYIRFQTDSSGTNAGFTGSVRSSMGPVMNNLQGHHGIVTTQEFPELYMNNASTAWQLTVSRGAITLLFTEFDIQPGTNGSCQYDKLEVRQDSASGTLLGTFCGSTLPPNITSPTGRLFLNFTTDDTIVRSGFRAIYYSDAAPCLHILNTHSGELFTPGYDRGLDYGAYLQCVWYIDVGEGIAKLNFDFWDVDYSSSCSQDRLMIYDGRQSNVTSIGTRSYYCGSSRPYKVNALSRYATLYFRSNGYANDRGFHAKFRSSVRCSETVRKAIGNITSPDYPSYYEPLTNCTWLIDVLRGNATLKLRVFDIRTSLYSGGCYQDVFEVYDGNSTSSPQVAGSPFCGSALPDTIVGTSQYLFVRMSTDGDTNGIGFVGDFWSSEYRCHMFGGGVLTFEYKGKCYGLFKESKTWSTARSFCESKNTSLLYLEDRKEFDAVSRYVYNSFSGNIWTAGYRRTSSSPSWYWSTLNGDQLYHQKTGVDNMWRVGEPDTSDKYVYLTSNGLSATSSTYYESFFVCKETPFTNSTPTAGPPKSGCSPPPHIQYGGYTPLQEHYNDSAVVTFTCNTNYELLSTNKLTCNNSRWTPQIPVCQDVTKSHCRSPPDVQFGSYSPHKATYKNGSKMMVTCDAGYEFLSHDNTEMTCNGGHWQGSFPACVHKETSSNSTESYCRVPPPVMNGAFTPSRPQYKNGSSVMITCSPSYSPLSDKHQKLLCVNEHWQNFVPVCVKDEAQVINSPSARKGSEEADGEDGISVILGVTITIIAILVVVIVVGVVWFVVKKRRGIQNERLVEMH